MRKLILRAVVLGLLCVFGFALANAGCGLGYLDASDTPAEVAFRIENGTTDFVLVSLAVPDEATDDAADPASQPTGEEPAGSDASRTPTQEDSTETTASPSSKAALRAKEAVIRIAPGDYSSGVFSCSALLTVSAQVGEDSPSAVVFTGAGTGTEGFDSGSVGITGERLLTPGSDFQCSDTVLVQITGADAGRIVTVPIGQALPDPISPSVDNTNDNDDTDSGGITSVTFQLQNATGTAVDFTIAEVAEDDGSTEEGDGAATSTEPLVIRVPAGQYSSGLLSCGATYKVSASLTSLSLVKTVSFSGDGAGTVGFDEGSLGALGERYLVFNTHYGCNNIIVATLLDDASGVGESSSANPIGEVRVYGSSEEVPPLDVNNDNDNAQAPDIINLVISNTTESYVQVHFDAGNASTVDTSFDVRVPPGRTTMGTGPCAQQYSLLAYHLEDADSDEDEGFHTVVILGDGTGAQGFDDNNVGIDNRRLLLLDEHFACSQTITLTITATNNTVDPDTTATLYGIGDGDVSVE